MNSFTRSIILAFCLISCNSFNSFSQGVAINADGSLPDSSAMLDIQSSDKGVMLPRVALESVSSPDPVNDPATGLILYNTSSTGDLHQGYYFWNGASWTSMTGGRGTFILNTVNKNTSDTLTMAESFAIASGDITLTLPVVTPADNGLLMSVKNNGSYLDLVIIKGSGSATIDGRQDETLTRYKSCTFVAYNGNWLIRDKNVKDDHIYDVSPGGSWNTIPEILGFLAEHMTEASVVRLDFGTYFINASMTIDLPFPLTIQGSSFGSSIIKSAPGFSGTALFNCISECYFKMLTLKDESFAMDAIKLTGPGEYYEIKDMEFIGFKRHINLTGANSEAWCFEMDLSDASIASIVNNGGSSFKVSECDFYNNKIGVYLNSAPVNSETSILNCGFFNGTTSIGIKKDSVSYTNFNTLIINNNFYNKVGTFISGFNFTRPDARDAQAFLHGNAGFRDADPAAHINVLNNSTVWTSIPVANQWYKINWGSNTTSSAAKMTLQNNSIQYQQVPLSDLQVILSGNFTANSNQNPRIIRIGIVKEGNPSVIYGETMIKSPTQDIPYLFSTVCVVPSVGQNQKIEVFMTSNIPGDQIRVEQLNYNVSIQ